MKEEEEVDAPLLLPFPLFSSSSSSSSLLVSRLIRSKFSTVPPLEEEGEEGVYRRSSVDVAPCAHCTRRGHTHRRGGDCVVCTHQCVCGCGGDAVGTPR